MPARAMGESRWGGWVAGWGVEWLGGWVGEPDKFLSIPSGGRKYFHANMKHGWQQILVSWRTSLSFMKPILYL